MKIKGSHFSVKKWWNAISSFSNLRGERHMKKRLGETVRNDVGFRICLAALFYIIKNPAAIIRYTDIS